MLRYIITVNRWTLFFIFCAASVAWAQEPIPPPPLPHNSKGWVDMLVKMSPFIIGVIAPYGNDLMKNGLPRIFGKVPTPIVMMISSLVSMLASGLTAYTAGLALENQGGVTPEVAMTETLATSIPAHKIAQKPPVDGDRNAGSGS